MAMINVEKKEDHICSVMEYFTNNKQLHSSYTRTDTMSTSHGTCNESAFRIMSSTGKLPDISPEITVIIFRVNESSCYLGDLTCT